MKIEREGREYELTAQELLKAYREQEKIFRFEDVDQHVADLNEWECHDNYGVIVTDHVLELFKDEHMKQRVIDEYDHIFSCDEPENALWENAIKNVISQEEEKLGKEAIYSFIDEMAKDGVISEAMRTGMKNCDKLLRKAASLVFRLGYDEEEAIKEASEHFKLLSYLGTDSHSRPVYSMEDGTLVVDIDNRSWRVPDLCTKLGNAFDGEPDTPLDKMESRKEDSYGFYPARKTV